MAACTMRTGIRRIRSTSEWAAGSRWELSRRVGLRQAMLRIINPRLQLGDLILQAAHGARHLATTSRSEAWARIALAMDVRLNRAHAIPPMRTMGKA